MFLISCLAHRLQLLPHACYAGLPLCFWTQCTIHPMETQNDIPSFHSLQYSNCRGEGTLKLGNFVNCSMKRGKSKKTNTLSYA